jgi:hypothetical protein
MRAQRRKNVLKVRSRGSERAERRGIEGPATYGEQADADDPARNLEAAAGDVLVRDPVPDEVRGRTEEQRAQAGTGRRADCGAGRNMQ